MKLFLSVYKTCFSLGSSFLLFLEKPDNSRCYLWPTCRVPNLGNLNISGVGNETEKMSNLENDPKVGGEIVLQ